MNQSILYIGTYSSPIMMGTGELYRGKGNGIHSSHREKEPFFPPLPLSHP